VQEFLWCSTLQILAARGDLRHAGMDVNLDSLCDQTSAALARNLGMEIGTKQFMLYLVLIVA
jgi:hypothetical protein